MTCSERASQIACVKIACSRQDRPSTSDLCPWTQPTFVIQTKTLRRDIPEMRMSSSLSVNTKRPIFCFCRNFELHDSPKKHFLAHFIVLFKLQWHISSTKQISLPFCIAISSRKHSNFSTSSVPVHQRRPMLGSSTYEIFAQTSEIPKGD